MFWWKYSRKVDSVYLVRYLLRGKCSWLAKNNIITDTKQLVITSAQTTN